MLAEQQGKEATATNAHADQEMAERLQAEAFGGGAGGAGANNAQSDADAALAAQLQAELNPAAAGSAGAIAGGTANATSAATNALVFRFKVTMDHVAKAGQIATVNSPEFGAYLRPTGLPSHPPSLCLSVSLGVSLSLCLSVSQSQSRSLKLSYNRSWIDRSYTVLLGCWLVWPHAG